MSLHYILDGYNILKQAPQLMDKKIKDGRRDFLKALETSPQLKKQQVTVVFDGYGDSQGVNLRENFKLLFSGNFSADDKIKRLVENSRTPKQIVVVSDDKEILLFVKMLGANILKVADFLFWISGGRSKAKETVSSSEMDDKDLNYKQVLEINRELKKRWLKES